MNQEKFTVTEAVFLVDRPLAEIQQAVDRNVIRPLVEGSAKRQRRFFGRAELRYLMMDAELKGTLSSDGKRRLYEEVSKLSSRDSTIKFGPVAIDLAGGDVKTSAATEAIEGCAKRNANEKWGAVSNGNHGFCLSNCGTSQGEVG